MLKIVSFNLRMPSKNDGINYLPNRIPCICERIHHEKPDLIGFQEMEDWGLQLMTEALPEYWIVGPGRNADWSGEGCRVAMLKETMTLLAFDQLWLSDTPRIPGSRYRNQSRCPRVVLWTKVRHKASGKCFYLINTHLDHESEEARILGLQSIVKLVETLKREEDLPVFVMGDFNFTPDEKPYDVIRNSSLLDLTHKLDKTYHGYKEIPVAKIDYILTDTTVDYRASQWHESKDGIYLSDHDPVCVEIDT